MMMSDMYKMFDNPLETLIETVGKYRENLEEGFISESEAVFNHPEYIIKKALIDFLADTIGKQEFFINFVNYTTSSKLDFIGGAWFGPDADGGYFIRELFKD